MERLFRSLSSKWVPCLGYRCLVEARRGIAHYLMGYCSRRQPHTAIGGLSPVQIWFLPGNNSLICQFILHSNRRNWLTKSNFQSLSEKSIAIQIVTHLSSKATTLWHVTCFLLGGKVYYLVAPTNRCSVSLI